MNYPKKFLPLAFFLLAVGAGVGLFAWLKFFCPTCRGVEQTPVTQVLELAPQAESQPPNLALEGQSGKIVSFDDLKGKNVLLVFWATKCGWCAKEKEDLMRFTKDYEGRIEVVAVVDEPRQTVLDYIEKENINFAVLLDQGRKTFEKYQVLGTPDHFLINKDGEVVARQPGYLSYINLLALTQLLEEK